MDETDLARLTDAIARAHPDCLTLADAGLSRLDQAEAAGLVALGLPLPRGRRDLVVPADRHAAILVEIAGTVDRARRARSLLARSRTALAGSAVTLHPGDAPHRLRAVLDDALPWHGFPEPVAFTVARPVAIEEIDGLDDTSLRARLTADPALLRGRDEAASLLARRLQGYIGAIGDGEDGRDFDELAGRLHRAARGHAEAIGIVARWDAAFDQWRRQRAEARARRFVDSQLDLRRFDRLFPVARGLGRRLVLVTGPTNSGKTHRALQALAAAESGVYLAPLRLLALEVMERLNRDGIPASLLTGEESVPVTGARHLASTIEMMDPDRPVAVAVIDEIQMLADPERGPAWTAALVGAPAMTVYLLGAPEARPLVERAAADLGEPLEIVALDRLGPLVALDRRLDWDDLEPGDALIAFSRGAVHALRNTVLARGLSVAAVYGALAPDVRRREAERFRSGAAAVIIATDAIGMGLNLPIRRVLFTALEKFDGHAVRPLHAAEIRQIAGRAGRHGQAGAGFYGVIGASTPEALARLLARPDARLRPDTPLPVRPGRGMLARLAAHAGVEELAFLVGCFAAPAPAASPYRVTDLAGLATLARQLDGRDLEFGTKLDLLFAPADPEHALDRTLFETLCRTLESRLPLRAGAVVPAVIDGLDDQGLEEAIRACELYHWAARRFPVLFPDGAAIDRHRATLGLHLADRLATGTRRRTQPPKPGFRGTPRRRHGPR